MEARLPALLLGLLQGTTEFLPVSSSGHLALAKLLFSIEDAPLAYDVLLHFATMLATLVYFGRDILSLMMEWFAGFTSADRRGEGWRTGWAVLAGTAVTAMIGLPLKPVVVMAAGMPWAVGAGLLLTAALLWGASLSHRAGEGREGSVSPLKGALVGIAQGFAVLPGVSRSGATMVAGLKLGMGSGEAFRLSFLMSVPAVLGATLLEARGLLPLGTGGGAVVTLPEGWVAGMMVAFASGLCSLALLRRMVAAGRWRPFAVYCALAGIAAIFLT